MCGLRECVLEIITCVT
ncbi:hypothetical protein F383_13907 [Gossypium arboreum]|uniref:Uncharacterized protein n=1 Tax=Gossypium arboreum TaxID=29729 RepID=A0A0B0NK50_GOSAR|nr:hypothetical protein F383_13907 [Gossypium arboreum]